MTRTQRVNAALRQVPSWAVYGLGALIPVYYLYLGLTGGLGVEPVNALERALGDLAIKALVVVLAVTPVRRWTGISLVMHRRALGLLAFFYVVCHLLVWALLDVQDFGRVWADIVKRPYISIGMIAFVLLLPVAATSNNLSIRKLGPVRWRRVHMLTYAIGVLGAAHYIMVQKTWEAEPLIYLAVILGLVATRLPALRREFAS
ncbi:protein-methionine-sulfoxide reductase heme-binding subunit MsrQ [Palleronia rufa]|uniref:protein-methionine-sulfoxide reductase heme-binding subunit MsrQ n=1 Tax=Palleronia rufa TaxID=1530186 RepID=UPI0005632D78|nr:protein-methionine-sulfoxide reductase heme-binding subunit MsrQ [Palleronia rufa]